MNHWPYIAAAYALTLGGMAVLVLMSWVRMRAAERDSSALKRPFASSAVEKPALTRADERFSTSLETNGEGAVGPA